MQSDPTFDQTTSLLQEYRELYAERKNTLEPAKRLRITGELDMRERQIRAALKANPIPEPIGKDKLDKIAERMIELGFEIFARRLTEQHFRHPIYVPFTDIDQVRSYVGTNVEDSVIDQIPELALPKKKKFLGMF